MNQKLELIKGFIKELLEEHELQNFYDEAEVEKLFLKEENFPFQNTYKVALTIFDLLLITKNRTYELV